MAGIRCHSPDGLSRDTVQGHCATTGLGPALAALVPRICLGPLRQRWPYLSLNSHSPTSPSENRRQAMASPRGDQESIETPSALSRSLGLPPAVGATMTVSP